MKHRTDFQRRTRRIGWLAAAAALCICPHLARAQQASPVSIVDAVSARNNATVADEDGDFPGYIVLRNNASPSAIANFSVNLAGWFLTDDASNPGKWQFPERTILAPQAELIVFASGKDRRPFGADGNLHTNFTYPCDVPFAGLYNPNLAQVSQFSKPDPACDEDPICRGTQLFTPNTLARYLIPQDKTFDAVWMQPGFSDADWKRGPLGIGYEGEGRGGGFCPELILYATLDRLDLNTADNTALDVSGSPNVHDGKGLQTLVPTTGQIQQAIRFDQEQTIHFGKHPELDPNLGDYSVSIWVQTFGVGDEVIASKGALGETMPGWMLFSRKDATVLRINIGGKTLIDVEMPRIKAETWTHIAFVLDRSAKQALLYADGQLMNSADLPGEPIVAPDFNLLLGAAADEKPAFSGLMDDFALWKCALTEEDVNQIFKIGAEGGSFNDNTIVRAASSTGLYAGLIGTDVEAEMRNVNPGIFIRVPFTIPDPSQVASLILGMHYDDGFVCYLNGQEVARRNAPSVLFPPFNSTSLSNRPDGGAVVAETIDLTGEIGLLSPGQNVLAIHGLNASVNEQRFLINPNLCVEEGAPADCEKTTNGRDFWLAFPGNAPEDDDNPLELTVCIAGTPGVSGVVEVPGLSFQKNYIIPANGPMAGTGCVTIQLPPGTALELNDTIESKGVHITASRDVSVYGTSRIDYSTDSFLGLPTTCLGREYVGLGYKNVWEDIPVLNGSQVAVVAILDDTEVTIDPSASKSGGAPITVTLDRGETYLLRDLADPDADLSGAFIRSTFPVGVFAGHRCANINGTDIFFCDYVVEHLFPTKAWGTEYFSAPLKTRAHSLADGKGDTLRIVASRDNSFVNIVDDSGANAINLGAGEVHEQLVIGPSHITAEFPVQAAVYSNSSDFDNVVDSDPFMTLLQDPDNWMDRYLICAPPTLDGASDFESNYVNIIARNTTEASTIRLNGVAVGGFQPLGATGYVYAQVDLDFGLTQHLLTSTRATFGLTVYGFSEFDSYGYPGSMRFESGGEPVVICPPPVTVAAEEECAAPAPDLRGRIQVLDPCGEGEPEPRQFCFDFEDLELGSVYRVKDTFVTTDSTGTQTVPVLMQPFLFSSGESFADGEATVVNGGQAGHTGNEFAVNNINFTFMPTSPWPGFSIQFGEFGGNVNFGLNGDMRNVQNFSEIHGLTIGGAQVTVVGVAGSNFGEIRVSGAVSEFIIGGQELFIDHLCSSSSSSNPGTVGVIEDNATRLGSQSTVTQEPAPGTMLPVGMHEVKLTVRNAQGQIIGACETKVTVVDNSPVVIECPPDMEVECDARRGAQVFYEGVRAFTERCQQPVEVVCEPPSGSFFPEGTTTVTCTAVGLVAGQAMTCAFNVTVKCDSPIPEDPEITFDFSSQTGLTLAWPEGGVLETAQSPSGPWTIVSGAGTSIEVQTTERQGYYRVRFEP